MGQGDVERVAKARTGTNARTGTSARRGHYIVLQDVYGNTYTYGHPRVALEL